MPTPTVTDAEEEEEHASLELMIKDTEKGISLLDRTTTTAGGINIAEFKRDVALKRWKNDRMSRGLIQYSAYTKGVFSRYGWNTDKISRIGDESETILALVESGDPKAADLVQKMTYLRGEVNGVYTMAYLEDLQSRVSAAFTEHPDLRTSHWLPATRTLASIKRSLSQQTEKDNEEYALKLANTVYYLTEKHSSTFQDIMDQFKLDEETRTTLQPILDVLVMANQPEFTEAEGKEMTRRLKQTLDDAKSKGSASSESSASIAES